MIFASFAKALGQLPDGPFLAVLFKGLALTLALLFAIGAAFLGVIDWFVPESFSILGWEITAVDNILSWGAVSLTMVLSVFLMVPVASAFTGLFLDEVADAVEARHYPGLPATPKLPLGDILRDSFGFLLLVIAANLAMLFFYLISGPFAPLLFWAVNGFLLGREYYQMIAMRRIGRAAAKQSRRRHVLTIWAAGFLMAAPLTIPLVNLVIPILGAATFTHIFHALERRG